MKDLTTQSLASIVTTHHKTAYVLEKYGLDFCCGGKHTLANACQEKGLDATHIATELQSVIGLPDGEMLNLETRSQNELINYIVSRHHQYMKEAMPAIHLHLSKVSTKHGNRFTYIYQVVELFDRLQKEMNDHLTKEENILFPIIANLENSSSEGNQCFPWGREIMVPIQVMETEHESAGNIMRSIRELTNNYSYPSDACMTHRLCMTELQDFETNLHLHMHMENNLLFPRFKQMVENKLRLSKRVS